MRGGAGGARASEATLGTTNSHTLYKAPQIYCEANRIYIEKQMSKKKKPSGGARVGGALHRVTGRREACRLFKFLF